MTQFKYIRTEPPALLTEAPTITMDDHALDLLNAYRQARHAYLGQPEGLTLDERGRVREAHSQAAAALAGYLAFRVSRQLGEPNETGAE